MASIILSPKTFILPITHLMFSILHMWNQDLKVPIWFPGLYIYEVFVRVVRQDWNWNPRIRLRLDLVGTELDSIDMRKMYSAPI